MKKYFFVTILCFSTWLANSQIAYYGSKEIRDNCIVVGNNTFSFKTSSKELLSSILKGYLPEDIQKDTTLSVDGILGQYIDNPFIGKEIAPLIGKASGSAISGLITQAGTTLGGLNVTNIANGIASLMIDRAKQELTVAFFNRFKRFAEKNPEFQILFPKTTGNLTNLLSYKYPQMLPVLRTGFFEDLNQLTYNLEGLLELPRYRTLLKNFPEVRIAIRSLKILHDLEKGAINAAVAIDTFANFPDWSDKGSLAFKNMGTTINFAAILSQSLRNQDTQKI